MGSLTNALSGHELSVLSSIVQVGDATYSELMSEQLGIFTHPYFADTKGRIRTKLVQMQCELESRNPKFPFEFSQRHFSYKQCIPELRNKSVILHIARSPAPDILPYKARYKIDLSNNNAPLYRQLIIDLDNKPPVSEAPYYGLLVFGGRKDTFITIQFPAPGYAGIAESINIPKVITSDVSYDSESFERKKAGLKQRFLAQGLKEALSNG